MKHVNDAIDPTIQITEEEKLSSLADAPAEELADCIVDALDGKKAHDIKKIAVADKTVITEYFVICTGNSNTQVHSLTDEVEFQLKRHDVEPLRIEGKDNNAWVVMDYGTVIVHIFNREARQFYNLEKLYQ